MMKKKGIKMLRKIIHNLPYIRSLRLTVNQQAITIQSLKEKGNHCFKENFYSKVFDDLDLDEKLQFLELKYGGYHKDVNPTKERIESGYKTGKLHEGGDRFNPFLNDYSKIYAKYLKNKIFSRILEIGVLKGTGLAIWSELYPNADLYGFDWDLGNFKINEKTLISKGAFKNSKPNLFQYNQLKNNKDWLRDNFSKVKFDFVIDDALHKDESIINSFIEIEEYLNNEFVYIIEDNRNAWRKLQKLYPQYHFENQSRVTVVTTKK